MTPADRLRQLADAVERGDPVPREVVDEAMTALRQMQSESSRAALRRRRDVALAALAGALAPAARVSARVDAVRQAVRRYEARWRRVDRYFGEIPISYVGRPDQHLWSAFSAGSQLDSDDPVPLGKTFLRSVLVSYCNNSDTESAA